MRKMRARYPGTCKVCGKRFPAGTLTYFLGKGLGAIHLHCKTDEAWTRSESAESGEATKFGDSTLFSIDWRDLKEISRQVMESGKSKTLGAKKSEMAKRALDGGTWAGFTGEQVERWMKDGYRVERVKGILPSLHIRDKSETVYDEEGDLLHVDLVFSGEDKPFSYDTETQAIPGIDMECNAVFVCTTDAKVIDFYASWIARAVYSLEEAGIDPQVSLRFASQGALRKFPGKLPETLVRVKREGERITFQDYSALLSPAVLRGFGFVAILAHGAAENSDVNSGYGSGHGGKEWKVSYNSERRKLQIDCPYHPRDFPAESMDKQLQDAIRSMDTV